MLHKVLREIQSSAGPVNLNELSRKTGIERSALGGMIAYWVRKGRLKDDKEELIAVMQVCNPAGCGGTCPGPEDCTFTMKILSTYSLRIRCDTKPSQ